MKSEWCQTLNNLTVLLNFSAVASCSLAAVSFIRCLAIWTDNKCRLLERHKTCLAFIWTIPAIALFAFYNSNWSDERHIRSSYVCSFFCGINSMRQYRNPMPENPKALINKSYIHNMTITDMEDYLDEDNHNKGIVPGWLFIIPPTLFHFIPLCILVVCYCMIWVKIKRSNDGIEGMVAFNKHKNEVFSYKHVYFVIFVTLISVDTWHENTAI